MVTNENIKTTNDVAGKRVLTVGQSIKGIENEDQSVASCESLSEETKRRWAVYGSQECGRKFKRRRTKGHRQLQQPTCTVGSMIRLRRQRPFLEAILKEANGNRRQEMLKHANADQINATSEIVLILLRNGIPVHPITMAKLHRYKTTLREIGKIKNTVKRRRKHLQ